MSECKCQLGSACARRGGIILPPVHHRRCVAGQGETLDRFYSIATESIIITANKNESREHAEAHSSQEPNHTTAKEITHTTNTVREPIHDVSTLGTVLRKRLETEIARQLTCRDCLGYLRTLNQRTEHDAAVIVQYLYANFPWPQAWRTQYPTKELQRARITQIVESAICDCKNSNKIQD